MSDQSVKYTPGMRVIIRDEEWMIKKAEKNTLGNDALYCTGITPLIKDREAIFLSDLEDIKVVDPAKVKLVADDSPHFIKSQIYIESQWRQKLPTDTKIHIGDKACMDPLPYQLEPAQFALRKPRQRILIADAVGLGKTLEAGILMSELIARGKGKRILVVTVKSMMTQFQKEMWNRFTIPLVRLDSARIQKIRANLPSNYNPFFYYDKTIVSVDTLKRDVEYRTHLENAYWDIIVIDEAQNVARRGDRQAQRSRLATLLADRSDTMIMLSATPHDGHAESFASLMKMLDPTAIANEKDYTPDDIKGLFIRRFKKDIRNQVSGAFLERKVKLEQCEASTREEYAYDIFANMHLVMDEGKTKGTGQLFKTSLEKSLFSSPAACIKSIEERLKKLRKKYEDGSMPDIFALEELEEALTQITDKDFSRYQKLLSILSDSEYGWHAGASDDRIVIFTERIETMKFLAHHLKEDLHMEDNQVQEISGTMGDTELQKIVEDFGREESPMRILVASDVASEGLNLHYLSHRMIHFDIPWSLMVFQQRNGRIDRYGQAKQPDIRYLVETCKNEDMRGDLRNLEILVTKEEQAQRNIGDPSLLLGQFEIEGEELIIAGAMENDTSEEAFSEMLNTDKEEAFNPLEALLAQAKPAEESTEEIQVNTTEDETLFKDIDYLYMALSYLGQKTKQPVEKLKTVSGLDIGITDDMRKRLNALIPEEAMPTGDHLLVSDNKQYCMNEMKNSMQKNMEETAWPTTQYLWKQHPLFTWINDKAGLLFKRDEVPVLGIQNQMQKGEVVFITNGSFPNKKSTSLIDDWFGVCYKNGQFTGIVSMEELVQITGLAHTDLVNAGTISDENLSDTAAFLEDAVSKAKTYLSEDLKKYRAKLDPLLSEEINKLASLEEKHKYYQMSLFESERKKSEQERKVDELFDKFEKWVTESLSIEDRPYIRFVAVLMGV